MTTKTVTRETHTIDATGQSFGRLASEVAQLLRGKHKPTWQPHLDNGDFVKITNVDQMKITGNKLDQKMYYRHTGYVGNLKEETLAARLERKGHGDVLTVAVYNMLPKNKLRAAMLKRLTIDKS